MAGTRLGLFKVWDGDKGLEGPLTLQVLTASRARLLERLSPQDKRRQLLQNPPPVVATQRRLDNVGICCLGIFKKSHVMSLPFQIRLLGFP